MRSMLLPQLRDASLTTSLGEPEFEGEGIDMAGAWSSSSNSGEELLSPTLQAGAA
jgi:hypothetical protein